VTLPDEIGPDETIARALRHDDDVNRNSGNVKYRSFRPRDGADRISVMRQLIGDTECKKRGKLIAAAANHGFYVGFQTALVSSVEDAGGSVQIDEGEPEYEGHAHLVFPRVGPADGEPADEPEDTDEWDQLLKRVFDVFILRLDSDPQTEEWTDATLRMTA
jgi:hypothetical protein